MKSKRLFRSRAPDTAGYPAEREALRLVAALGAAATLSAGLSACGAAPQPNFNPDCEALEDGGLSADAGTADAGAESEGK